jgi:hypothetical protein
VEFEPPTTFSGPGGAVYRCLVEFEFSGGYGNPTGGDAN